MWSVVRVPLLKLVQRRHCSSVILMRTSAICVMLLIHLHANNVDDSRKQWSGLDASFVLVGTILTVWE